MGKEKKVKFNLVDVIVLLILLAGAAFVALRVIGPRFGLGADQDPTSSVDPSAEPTMGEEKEYILTFYVPESADYIVSHLWAGSPLTDDSIKLDLGTVVDYETGPARISSAAADGHLVISDREGYSSVYIMSRVLGADNGFGVTVDGLKLEIGHSMVIRAKEAKFWAYVYDIQELEDSSYANR